MYLEMYLYHDSPIHGKRQQYESNLNYIFIGVFEFSEKSAKPVVKFVIYLNALIDWKHEQFTLVAFGVSLSHSVICRPCVTGLARVDERGARLLLFQ